MSSAMDHGICWLIQLLVLGLQIHINEGLENSQVNAVVNENRTRYITIQCEGLKFTTGCVKDYRNNSQVYLVSPSTDAEKLLCPPWYQRKMETVSVKVGLISDILWKSTQCKLRCKHSTA